ncbi:MAG: PAS domain S-box protein [Desulfomonilaceae bacterium]|nr:PAS domain S-box protein [Desulfomonilaceae bacterium]
MDEHRPLSFEHLQRDEATETIDFTTWVPNDLTFTGSFDLRNSGLRSFTNLLDAIPIPAFLVDGGYAVVFGNTASGLVGGRGEHAGLVELSSLFPTTSGCETVRTMLEATFTTRQPRVTEAALIVRGEEIWGRIHLRSIRMGSDRFVLVLVEDLTLEKKQLQINQRHQEELISARNDLEKRVEERTGELTAANARLRNEILERRRAEEELRMAHNQLEQRVQERTSELRTINGRLIKEILHRREAEKALKKSEDKFRTIFRHSLDVILLISGEDGAIIGGNDAVKDVLNYEMEDIVGKHVSILYPRGDDLSAVDNLDEVRPHGPVFEAQQVLCGDGRTIPMDLTATTIPWNGGTAILATFRDVGARESALEALRDSEKRYRTLFDQAGNAIVVENEKGEIVDCNRAAATLSGYSAREITLMKMSDLCVASGREPAGDSHGAIEGAGPAEMVVLKRDGTMVPVEVNRAPLRTGGETLFLSIMSDITDRKRVERLTLAQRDLSTRLSAVSNLDEALLLCVDSALQVSKMDSAGIYLTNRSSGLDLAAHRGLTNAFLSRATHLHPRSPQTRRIMEGLPVYSGQTPEGSLFSPFEPSDGFEAIAVIPIHHEATVIACFITGSRTMNSVSRSLSNELEAITAQMGSAIARLSAEAALRKAHQELEIRVDERTEELLEANKRLEQEITQRKTAEQHIRRSLQEKEALLQEVHHRVKNNLQIISSLLALQSTHVRDKKTLEVLTDSQSRIRSMAFIHEHLYRSQDLARIDFAAYIRDLLGALLQSYSHVGSRVSLRLDVDPVFLGVGTALPCGLIMNELVSNCLRHAFPGDRNGEILVRVRSTGARTYELSVADNGTGLPEQLDYRQSDSLGLRLVTNLTELQLRGSLDVSSRNGTTVKIEFEDREHINHKEDN